MIRAGWIAKTLKEKRLPDASSPRHGGVVISVPLLLVCFLPLVVEVLPASKMDKWWCLSGLAGPRAKFIRPHANLDENQEPTQAHTLSHNNRRLFFLLDCETSKGGSQAPHENPCVTSTKRFPFTSTRSAVIPFFPPGNRTRECDIAQTR